VTHLQTRAATGRSGRVGRGRHADLTPMTLAACVSVCALPFVFLLVMPWFGFRVALGAALAIVTGTTIVCWLFCAAARLPDERG
jgi:Na+-driven multidrug efflux pump